MLYSKDLPERLFIHFTDKAQLIVFFCSDDWEECWHEYSHLSKPSVDLLDDRSQLESQGQIV